MPQQNRFCWELGPNRGYAGGLKLGLTGPFLRIEDVFYYYNMKIGILNASGIVNVELENYPSSGP
jgi:hypothetical protein